MVKSLIEIYIRKTKNSVFKFDENLSNTVLINFTYKKILAFLRGLRFYDFKRRGNFIFFGRNVQLLNKKNMLYGNNVIIGDYVKLSALGRNRLQIGNNVNIGAFSQIIISTSFNDLGSHIRIEENVGIGEFAYIGGAGGTIIGKNTIIGQYFSTHPENHNFSDINKLIRLQGVTRKGIRIGENCWIGSKVTILDGVSIGDNCVIAAGAVVTKDFPKCSTIGGVPAKILKSR